MYIWLKRCTRWVVCNSSFILLPMISFLCCFLYFWDKSPLLIQNTNQKDSVDWSPMALLCYKYNPNCWIIIFHSPLFVTNGCWSWKKNHLWFAQTYTKFDRGRKKILTNQHNNKIIKSTPLFSSRLGNQAFYLTSRVNSRLLRELRQPWPIISLFFCLFCFACPTNPLLQEGQWWESNDLI